MMRNTYNSNVSTYKQDTGNGTVVLPLPLQLIALVISYLDQPSDLARLCRTCRVFHYMTLPQLYSNVSLRSYDYIRYSGRDGRPDGCGMASPFSMGLNGLVSRNIAGYTKNFEIGGEWKEHELEEHSKVGRVPDESMMLNTLVRVAVEKMTVLDSFSWELNIKMLPTIWQGLAQNKSLTKLTVKFPSSRHPRPITVVPPMQNLQYLKITDIDPLCYADDISLLLLGSKRLRDMKLHWSPRMREHREPSVHQAAYFGKIYAAGYSIPLRSIAIQNLYTHHGGQCYPYFDNHTVEEVTLLNSTGGLGDDGGTEFMDKLRWHTSEKDAVPTNLKMLRIDKISRQQCEFLASIKGLEKLYLIGPHARPSSKEHSNGATPLPHSPVSSYSSASSTDNTNIISLKDDYIEAIAKNHGRTLRHLLLLPQWRLTDDDIALIVRQCPNLEQVGIGAEFSNCKHLRLLVPFLANLTALRLLGNPDDPSFVHKMRDLDGRGMHIKKITEEAARLGESKLRFLELGADDMIFKIDRRALYDQGVGEVRKAVRKGGWEDVKDVDIWAMDSLEI